MNLRITVWMMLAQMGCASLTASPTDRLRITASVPNAVVSVDGENRGPAPVAVELPKNRRSHVVVRAPGYRPMTCSTAMTPAAGYVAADIALCVLLFPIGCMAFIDAFGAWNVLASSSCEAELRPQVESLSPVARILWPR